MSEIYFNRGMVWIADEKGTELNALSLEIGLTTVSIRFETTKEFLDFCTKHNIEIRDDRNEKRKTK